MMFHKEAICFALLYVLQRTLIESG